MKETADDMRQERAETVAVAMRVNGRKLPGVPMKKSQLKLATGAHSCGVA
jgi:hypothetical protein